MQAAYIAKMEDWRPYRTYRQQRLETLLTEAGGPKELMRLSEVTDTYLTACRKGKRFVGDDVAGRLEKVMDRPSGLLKPARAGFFVSDWRSRSSPPHPHN